MDYNVAMRSIDCPFTITFYGALFREVHPHTFNVHVCMCTCQFVSIVFNREMCGYAWN